MDRLFEHVAEKAERAIDDPDARCQYCERAYVPVFGYPGVIVDPSRAANPELATTDPEVFELCADCINSSAVERNDDFEASRLIAHFATDPKAALAAYHRLPDIPLFLQRFDWPICCGTWCVFTGSPTDHAALVAVQSSLRYWQQGPALRGRDFASEGEPKSMTEISCFRCDTCGERYYTDQFT